MKLKELLQIMQGSGLSNTTQLCQNIAQLEAQIAAEILQCKDFILNFDDYTLPAHAEKELLLGFEAFALYAAYLHAQECLSRNELTGYNSYQALFEQLFERTASAHRKQNRPDAKILKYWS